jgi:hypothetical protein
LSRDRKLIPGADTVCLAERQYAQERQRKFGREICSNGQ